MIDTSQPNDNAKTLQSYEDHVREYIAGTPQTASGDVKEWLDKALALLRHGDTILELGSAFGRDADYIESKGYSVDRTDATKAFVDLLQTKGHPARVLNAITDNFGGPYAMVLANAVLLHFNSMEAKKALQNAYTALQDNGVMAFTVKQGNGELWTDDKLGAPRYFCFWQTESLRKLVEEAGFDVTEITNGETKNAQWLQVIARKTP